MNMANIPGATLDCLTAHTFWVWPKIMNCRTVWCIWRNKTIHKTDMSATCSIFEILDRRPEHSLELIKSFKFTSKIPEILWKSLISTMATLKRTL